MSKPTKAKAKTNKKEPKGKRDLFVPVYKQFEGKKIHTHLTCQICGKEFKNLATHVYRIHNMSLEEYTMDFPETEYFLSEELRIGQSLSSDNYLLSKKRKITPKEIAFIKKNYLQMTYDEIAETLDLLHETVSSLIKKHIPYKKHVERPWQHEEIEFIKKHYLTKSYPEIGKELGRTASGVNYMLNELGLKKAEPGMPWTEEEKKYLKKHYKNYTHGELAARLGRSEESVSAQLLKMDLRKTAPRYTWTEKELKYIREHYKEQDSREMARHLGCSRNAVLYLLQKNGWKTENMERRWSQDEIEFLTKNYNQMTCSEIAEELERGVEAIQRKAHHQGLKKTAIYYPEGAPQPGINTGKQWLQEEEEYLKSFYREKTVEELADFLGRTERSVYIRMMDLGLLQQDEPVMARTEKGKNHYWTDEDTRILINWYMIVETKVLADYLGYSYNGVKKKAREFGLKKTQNW